MKINKERTGLGLSVRSGTSASDLKNYMTHAAEVMSNIFVPSDITWDNDTYTFYISHRQSLKDYIFENGFDAKGFFAFISRICELFAEAEKNGISPYGFIFNYECVFVGNSPYDLEFIYAPDAETYKAGRLVYNKCSDMAAIASLHIEYSMRERSKGDEKAVSDILRILSEWEALITEGECTFPYEDIKKILDAHTAGRIIKRISPSTWHPFAIFEAAAFFAALLWEYSYGGDSMNIYLYAVWIVFMICVGFLLIPESAGCKRCGKRDNSENAGKKQIYTVRHAAYYIIEKFRTAICRQIKKEVYIMRLKGELLLKDIKYTANNEADEIRIGRDDEWADVALGLIFVSRHHAELYRQDGEWYIKDLFSTNGTFVNGSKINPEQPVRLQNGSRICIGVPQSELIFRLP